MIKVSETAKKQALRLMEDEGKANAFIRVGVKGGGCSGLTYQLTFDDQMLEQDKSFEDNGVKVVVDKKSFLYLKFLVNCRFYFLTYLPPKTCCIPEDRNRNYCALP